MYNILSVTSYSGVGKTTLIENIVKRLTDRGYKVGTIKHTCHDFDLDTEGKDSYRHRKAGASKVCIVSSNRLNFIEELDKEKKLNEIIEFYRDMDLIIIEGYKKYSFKKLEIIRKDKYEEIISDKKDLVGIVSDMNYKFGITQFKLNEYDEIVDYIEECLHKKILYLSEEDIIKIIELQN